MRSRRIPPAEGQESVWDYPRPPRLERNTHRLQVVLGGVTIADTTAGYRVLETSHPPNYYLPMADIAEGTLTRVEGSSFCEWKGVAHYYDVASGHSLAAAAAWGYDSPTRGFAPIAGHVAFYPGRMDTCLVDGEVVEPQPGGFYGGWITTGLVGPFKGDPGTQRW